MTPPEIVIDTSALLRGLLAEEPGAEEVVAHVWSGRTRAHAPELIVAESTHALLRLVRAGRLEADDARRLADDVDRAPIERHGGSGQARAALEVALVTRLSGYDALYAVLAEALEVPLVTADRRLADAVPGSLLVA